MKKTIYIYIISCSTLSHKQTKHTNLSTVNNIFFLTYSCLCDKNQYSTSLPLFPGKAIDNIP